MAIEPLCDYVEQMTTPFDKKTWQREYMREYRRGQRRRQSHVEVSTA